MGRKQEWEKEFEMYDKQEEAKRINKLSAKFEEKSISRQEYEELKKLIVKFKNVEKVANIIELKNQLEEQRKKINKEIEEVKKQEKQQKNNEKMVESNKKLEEELNKIQEELSDVSNKLKSNDLSDEERKNLENKKIELTDKKDRNNNKYVENQEKLQNIDNKEIKDIGKLEEEKEDIGIKISKCCFAGKMLMAGKSWEYIEVKYEENKKYTDKNNSLSSKVANQRGKQKEDKNVDKNKVDTILKETENKIGKEVEKIKNEENALVEQTEFQRKHPRLSKIFSTVKNFFNRNDKSDDVEKEIVNEKTQKDAKTDVKEEKSQRDEFMNYLKSVAEKGVEQTDKENAVQRLQERKKEAYDREKEKFGKDYAEMSYKIEDEGLEHD